MRFEAIQAKVERILDPRRMIQAWNVAFKQRVDGWLPWWWFEGLALEISPIESQTWIERRFFEGSLKIPFSVFVL
jgi:hypothetical protein